MQAPAQDAMPVFVAIDSLQYQSAKYAVEQARGKQGEALNGTCDQGNGGEQPVMQMEFVALKGDDDGPDASLDAGCLTATILARGKAKRAAEIEEITESDAGGNKTHQNDFLTQYFVSVATGIPSHAGEPEGRLRIAAETVVNLQSEGTPPVG